MADKIYFWGYLHQNNTIQVKRWFGDHKDYTDDCKNNPFVIAVVPPFESNDNEEALEIIREELRKQLNGTNTYSVKNDPDEIQIAFL
ncbi:MAG TPA: hypothetical protein VI911_10395 [Patescibacteria group bacterium]|nr:hypothetical protein [Patescibacteria group bacterium]